MCVIFRFYGRFIHFAWHLHDKQNVTMNDYYQVSSELPAAEYIYGFSKNSQTNHFILNDGIRCLYVIFGGI